MPGKIFISYRRDDEPSAAARVRDGLAGKFGKTAMFMDVDNLLAGQRFDDELAKALKECDVLVAIIGGKWTDILAAKTAAGERDYVREEIGAALERRIVVIPVRVGSDGLLAPLPRPTELPDDIHELVQHQKHDVVHEKLGRDVGDLAAAIAALRHSKSTPKPWGKIAAGAVVALLLGGGVVANQMGLVPWSQSTKAGLTDEEMLATWGTSARPTSQSPQLISGGGYGSGQSFRDCADVCPETVVVPAGDGVMGEGIGQKKL